MRIRYSPRATKDLASICQYLTEHRPAGATNVMAAILAAVEFIRRNPLAAEVTNVRSVHGKTVRRYRFKVFYRVLVPENVVEIVHVRHTSRKPWSGQDD
jgi:plasmid stabilization system protein ParE